MRCAACQDENREGRKFCASCGAILPTPCPDCGYLNQSADRFCGGCGAALGRDDHTPVEVSVETTGDRRPVTVLFCDLVGYTRLSTNLDPEEVHALLEKFFAVVDAIVDRFGGVIDKHIGDAAMALFGAPRAHGDDALRAVRAASEIQDAVGKLAGASGPLAVHVGVAMGEVIASSVGSDRHRGYTVTGEAANIAARLLDRASAGETLVSDAVYRATSDAADYEPMGVQSLKGLDRPVETWRLTGLRRAAARAPDMIGRRPELAQCRAALDAIAEDAAGTVVVLRGEPGIGKTRFVEELQSVASARGMSLHAGWILDFGTERGQGAIRTIVASLLGLARDTPPEEVERAVVAATRDASPPNDEALYLRDLLDAPQLEETRSLYEALDSAARARGKERVLVDLVSASARRRPLLLTVDDVHWADAATLTLLAAIARATKQSRTALVITTRIEGDPIDAAWRAAAAGSSQLTIDLPPLAPAEALSIAKRFPAGEALAAKCVERAGGNPLFLEQLLRTADDLVDGQLPNSIQNVVLARTDLLAAQDRRAIEAAAVLGQRFALNNLRALLNDQRYECEALLRRALLRSVGDGLQFVHALVRDGVYASLTRARRRELHRSAGRIFLDDPVLRAEHLDRAGDLEAPRAYLAASKDQWALFRQDQAATLAARGLSLAVDSRDLVDLALHLGDLQQGAGRGAEALEAYQRALSAGVSEHDRLRALIGCAAANRLMARLGDAFVALAEAEPLAHGADDALVEIRYLRGNLYFARGDLAACRNEHSAALTAAQRIASSEWKARALSGLADAQYLDCRMATALRHFSECVELCDANGFTRIAVPNRVMMGHCRIYVCAFDVALNDMRKALETARRIGDRHAEMFALQSSGWCLAACGRYDAIGEVQVSSLEQARVLKARRYEAAILAISSEVALAEGRRGEALALAREALCASNETGPGFLGPMVYGLLALSEDTGDARRSALSVGEALLAKGAVGHNHFWFRRYAIEQALLAKDWDAAAHHADALLARMSGEPLPYVDYFGRRGRALARLGRGDAADDDETELEKLRAKAAKIDLRIDALGDALRRA